MQRTLLLIGCILATVVIQAQDYPGSFTLQEAIAFAREYNANSINAEREIIDARKQKWETIASGLPQINGAVNYQNRLIQPVSLVPAEFFGGDPGTFQPVVFGQPQQASATATLTQQIFDGSYIVGVQATKAFLSYSKNNLEKTEQEVRKAVVEAYGNVLLSKESVAILRKNVANLQQNLEETKEIYETGLGEEESVEQLQLTLASVQNSLRNSERLELITLQMLNLVMGLPLDHPTRLSENLEELVVEKIVETPVSDDFNVEQNVDYKLAKNLQQQRYYEMKLAKSRALPTLNAFLNYGATAYDQDFSFFDGETEWFESSILGFDLSIPIFSSLKRSASTQRAKIALEQAETQLTQAEKEIRLQVARARSDYQMAIENYRTSRENLRLAERIENKNQVKFEEGLASSFDLRQAQQQLYASQQEYLQAMVAVITSRTQLETLLNNN